MPWGFLIWLLCFCLQAALVGFAFYVLIQLYDFEEDLMNTFDCAKRCNRLMSPEIIVQALVLVLSIAGGHFIAAALNLAGIGLLGYYYSKGKLLLDAQELWKQLPKAKQFTYFRLAAYGTAFAFTMFRLIEMIVHELLSDHGRFMLREALRDTIHI